MLWYACNMSTHRRAKPFAIFAAPIWKAAETKSGCRPSQLRRIDELIDSAMFNTCSSPRKRSTQSKFTASVCNTLASPPLFAAISSKRCLDRGRAQLGVRILVYQKSTLMYTPQDWLSYSIEPSEAAIYACMHLWVGLRLRVFGNFGFVSTQAFMMPTTKMGRAAGARQKRVST